MMFNALDPVFNAKPFRMFYDISITDVSCCVTDPEIYLKMILRSHSRRSSVQLWRRGALDITCITSHTKPYSTTSRRVCNSSSSLSQLVIDPLVWASARSPTTSILGCLSATIYITEDKGPLQATLGSRYGVFGPETEMLIDRHLRRMTGPLKNGYPGYGVSVPGMS